MSRPHSRSPQRLAAWIVAGWALAAAPALAAPQATPPPLEDPGRPPRQATPQRPPDPARESRRAPTFTLEAAWTTVLPSAAAFTPAVDAERAYVAMRNGQLAAVSLSTGGVSWTVDQESAVPPAAGGGLVFVVSADGLLTARRADTGKGAWEVPLPGQPAGPLAWQNGWLVAGTEAGDVWLLRADNGTVAWKQAHGSPLAGYPAMTGERVYLFLQDRRVVAADLKTGSPTWIRTLGGTGTALVPLDDRVFVGSADKSLYCLSARDGRLMWRWRTGGAPVGMPVLDREHIYFVSLDNVLRALDRGNGIQQWKQGLEFRPVAGPFLVGTLLLVSGVSAEIRGFKASDGTATGSASAASELLGAPVLVPGTGTQGPSLVVVTGEGQIQRLSPAAPPLPSKPIRGLPAQIAPPVIG